jgi:hypothetical protein
MSFREEVDRVLREEERKNRRSQNTPSRRTARQFEQPTYFAILCAKLLIRFGRGRSTPVMDTGIPKKKVSFVSIVREDISRFFSQKKKVKVPESNESWDDWKESFTRDEPGKEREQ